MIKSGGIEINGKSHIPTILFPAVAVNYVQMSQTRKKAGVFCHYFLFFDDFHVMFIL
jgi:hypothetical protein